MKIKLKGERRLCAHKFHITNLQLLKNVTNSRKLDAYESIFLLKNKKKRLMNDEQQALGNIQSPLFKLLYLIKVTVELQLIVEFADRRWLHAEAEINNRNNYDFVKSETPF
jgi:hypothetical protein